MVALDVGFGNESQKTVAFRKFVSKHNICHAMKTKGMVFRYMWVYSKEDTMAHTHRPVVTS